MNLKINATASNSKRNIYLCKIKVGITSKENKFHIVNLSHFLLKYTNVTYEIADNEQEIKKL